MPVKEKYGEIAFWRMFIKSILKSSTTSIEKCNRYLCYRTYIILSMHSIYIYLQKFSKQIIIFYIFFLIRSVRPSFLSNFLILCQRKVSRIKISDVNDRTLWFRRIFQIEFFIPIRDCWLKYLLYPNRSLQNDRLTSRQTDNEIIL